MMHKLFPFFFTFSAITTTVFCSLIQGYPLQFFVTDPSTEMIHHGKETLNSLHGYGQVTLEETKILKLLSVKGSLLTKEAHLSTVKINGQAIFLNSHVNETCDVYGVMSAFKSTFAEAVHVTSEKALFQSCKIHSLEVYKTPWSDTIQVVELCKSTCQGDIRFESGKGRVIVCDKSQIKGKVIGGQILLK